MGLGQGTLQKLQRFRGKPLRVILVVPFVLQIFTAVSLTGWLALRNGQRAVNDVADQLRDEVTMLIEQQLKTYLKTPHTVNAITVDAIRRFGLWNPNDMSALRSYLLWELQQFPTVSYISFGGEQTEYAGAGRKADGTLVIESTDGSTGFVNTILSVNAGGTPTGHKETYPEYDPRTRPWYLTAKATDRPIWNSIYQYYIEANLGMSASRSFYDEAGKFRGVVSTDIYLTGISEFLRGLKIGKTGETFIIERSGLIVASSTEEVPFSEQKKGQAVRLLATDSQIPRIRETSRYLSQQFGSFAQIQASQQLDFKVDGQRQFVQVEPFSDGRGLDWLIVVVVPESDFMGQIEANTQTTILLCLLALVVATGLGLLTSQWIADPIVQLVEASRAIANGRLTQKVQIQGVRELETLSDSFNQMADQLKASFEDLEVRVEQRTAELKEAKEAAEVAHQAKSEFLSTISHELRTPLNVILGFTQILKRQSLGNPDQRTYLGIINRSGESLLNLINDVLDTSKIEAGQLALDPTCFSLAEMLAGLQEMFQMRVTLKGLCLTVECSSEVPPYIRADEKKLRQTLMNLLSNALKFTDTGSITLRVEQVPQPSSSPEALVGVTEAASAHPILRFSVQDTGSGIADADLEHIFEPFVQTRLGQQAGQGTGLGLSISRQFVRLMGGELWACSTLNQGTLFYFDIPVEPVEAVSLPTPPIRRQVIGLAPHQSTHRILVVDPGWENRQLIVKLLETVGFEVREADSCQNAIALWQTWQPHLIWLHIWMPKSDSYTVVTQIRELEQVKAQTRAANSEPTVLPSPHRTRILAITASSDLQEKAHLQAIGCDDFVQKPFREGTLFEKMAQHLGITYQYEASEAPIPGSPSQVLRLTSADLQVMPEAWRLNLHWAAQTLQPHHMIAVIEQIPAEHRDLAEQLQHLVKGFRYDIILDLTHPVTVT